MNEEQNKPQVNLDELAKQVAKGRMSIWNVRGEDNRAAVQARLDIHRDAMHVLTLAELRRAVQLMEGDDPEDTPELKQIFKAIRKHTVVWEKVSRR
jgi:hypothetical protein